MESCPEKLRVEEWLEGCIVQAEQRVTALHVVQVLASQGVHDVCGREYRVSKTLTANKLCFQKVKFLEIAPWV